MSPRSKNNIIATAFALGAMLGGAGLGLIAQGITIPNTFVNQTTASATQVNANFTSLAAGALNRAGGTMTGTLTAQQITPASTATYDLGTTATRFRDGWFSRTLTVGGGITAGSGVVGIVDSTGKIPALSSTYLTDLSGANLTTLNGTNVSSGTVAVARLGTGTPTNANFLRGDGTFATVINATEFNAGNSATAITLNFATNGPLQKVTRTGSATYTLTAPTYAGTVMLRLIHEATATAYTVTFSPAVKYPSGTAPTWTNTSGAVDIISLYWDGAAWWGVQSPNFS